ncbi:MAG: collagen-like protein [Betaproteobacteria bacterium]|nr:collagen-like protein [Betaproteobacteria bacterium]
MTDTELALISRGLAPVMRAVVAAAVEPLLARIAILEQRAPVPGRDGRDGAQGPQGPAGEKGADGANGRDGSDGRDGAQGPAGEKGLDGKDGLMLTAADITRMEFDGEKTITLWVGDRSLALPWWSPSYKGVWSAADAYGPGDLVTWSGSLWIARDSTTDRPGDGKTGWQLCVKAGRDGKPGPAGPEGKPGQKGDKGDRGPDRW